MPKCKECQKEIKWIRMVTGGVMPVDHDQVKIIRVNKAGKGMVVGGYTPHWGTCTAPEKFRKRDKRRFPIQNEEAKNDGNNS